MHENVHQDVEEFAALIAALTDPFGRRDVELEARGLDETTLGALTAAWAKRLAADAGLRSRHQAAYKAERARRSKSAAGASQSFTRAARSVPLHPQGPAQPLLLTPMEAIEALMPMLDPTLEVRPRVALVLPFIERDDLGIPLAVARAAAQTEAHEDTGTLTLGGGVPAGPATPFPDNKQPATGIGADDDGAETLFLDVSQQVVSKDQSS